jgi:hypothetical protein
MLYGCLDSNRTAAICSAHAINAASYAGLDYQRFMLPSTLAFPGRGHKDVEPMVPVVPINCTDMASVS